MFGWPSPDLNPTENLQQDFKLLLTDALHPNLLNFLQRIMGENCSFDMGKANRGIPQTTCSCNCSKNWSLSYGPLIPLNRNSQSGSDKIFLDTEVVMSFMFVAASGQIASKQTNR